GIWDREYQEHSGRSETLSISPDSKDPETTDRGSWESVCFHASSSISPKNASSKSPPGFDDVCQELKTYFLNNKKNNGELFIFWEKGSCKFCGEFYGKKIQSAHNTIRDPFAYNYRSINDNTDMLIPRTNIIGRLLLLGGQLD